MFFNEIATSILIVLGAAIMFLSVLETRKLLGLLKESKYIPSSNGFVGF